MQETIHELKLIQNYLMQRRHAHYIEAIIATETLSL